MRPLALTMGDPAGIGGEITLAAWRALRGTGPCFALLGDPAWLAVAGARPVVIPAQAGIHRAPLDFRLRGNDEEEAGVASSPPRGYGVPVVEIATIAEAAAVFSTALPVLPLPLVVAAEPGRPDPANAPAVIASIEQATRLAQSGEAAGVVTNPISKATLYGAGFGFPGHTEFLAALTGVPGQEVMMLAGPALRVVPVTVHVSLRRALEMLSTEAIIAAARTTAAALRSDFGITVPRLAVAGLNPHAGEGGALGTEENDLILPALAALRAEGIAVSGPWPPDTMFTDAARPQYDAAICMYHDQALIPLKTLDMRLGVNVTLGLPIVRTSPDHGTAFDIAGRGVADPASLIEALRMAAAIAERRAVATRIR